jgi:hypothetical protein
MLFQVDLAENHGPAGSMKSMHRDRAKFQEGNSEYFYLGKKEGR